MFVGNLSKMFKKNSRVSKKAWSVVFQKIKFHRTSLRCKANLERFLRKEPIRKVRDYDVEN